MVRLKISHLYIDAEVAKAVFGEDERVNLIYYPDRNDLLICGVSQSFFTKLHKDTSQHLLKNRNLNGDKTLALHELLIDNEIEDTDRELVFEIKNTGILMVKL
jgi:hypothetical protein